MQIVHLLPLLSLGSALPAYLSPAGALSDHSGELGKHGIPGTYGGGAGAGKNVPWNCTGLNATGFLNSTGANSTGGGPPGPVYLPGEGNSDGDNAVSPSGNAGTQGSVGNEIPGTYGGRGGGSGDSSDSNPVSSSGDNNAGSSNGGEIQGGVGVHGIPGAYGGGGGSDDSSGSTSPSSSGGGESPQSPAGATSPEGSDEPGAGSTSSPVSGAGDGENQQPPAGGAESPPGYPGFPIPLPGNMTGSPFGNMTGSASGNSTKTIPRPPPSPLGPYGGRKGSTRKAPFPWSG